MEEGEMNTLKNTSGGLLFMVHGNVEDLHTMHCRHVAVRVATRWD